MGKQKPFVLTFNEGGVDEKSGIFYLQPSSAEIIQNMHFDSRGSFSAKNQGFQAINQFTFTADASTDVLTSASHPFASGQTVKVFSSDTLPAGLTEGTTYYVGTVTTDTFKLYTDSGLTLLVDITDTGTGTHKIYGNYESGASVDSLGWFTDTSGTDYLLAACNGKIKHINYETGAEVADIATGLTAGNRVDFCGFKGILFAAEPSIAMKKWTGSGSMSAAGGFPIVNGSESYDQPTWAERFANRLVVGNFQGTTKYPAHIAISNDLDPETFTLTAGTSSNGTIIPISPGDGQAAVGARSLYIAATNETILAVFKERSLYAITGTSRDDFAVQLINTTYGALNNDCVRQFGNDLVLMDQNVITTLSTANNSGTIQIKDISAENVRKTLRRLNYSQRDKAWIEHIPWRRELWFGIPTGSSTEVDTIMVYHYPDDPNNPDTPGLWTIRKNTAPSCPLIIRNNFYTGDYDGYINKWFSNSRYHNTAFEWIYKYPWFNFGAQAQIKRVNELFAWFLVNEPMEITITTEWRGGGSNNKRSITRTVDIGQGGAVFGTVAPPAAIFGVDLFGDIPLGKAKSPVYGNGEQLRLQVQGETGDSGPIFLGMTGLVEYGAYSRSYK